MISADAVEAAEREFKVGVKRLVISALENPLFQERLRLARARTDFPGPDALTVAMDMEDFMTGIATEMIKLLNIPLVPKGKHRGGWDRALLTWSNCGSGRAKP